MTRPWSDEQLSAFLDGELPAADMDALAREIEADAQLAARVERLGAANTAFIAAMSEIDRKPMSPGVVKVLAAPPTAKVLAFRPRAAAWLKEHRALAASLICAAMAAGVVSGLKPPADPFAPKADGLILASSPLHHALEVGATGEGVLISAGVTATPRLTFASDAGAFCRQFDVATQRGVTSAIACREKGSWRTEVAVFGRPHTQGMGSSADYQTASGAKSPALEAFIDQNISGAALDAELEKAAIARGWK
jgi:hypothetical protein